MSRQQIEAASLRSKGHTLIDRRHDGVGFAPHLSFVISASANGPHAPACLRGGFNFFHRGLHLNGRLSADRPWNDDLDLEPNNARAIATGRSSAIAMPPALSSNVALTQLRADALGVARLAMGWDAGDVVESRTQLQRVVLRRGELPPAVSEEQPYPTSPFARLSFVCCLENSGVSGGAIIADHGFETFDPSDLDPEALKAIIPLTERMTGYAFVGADFACRHEPLRLADGAEAGVRTLLVHHFHRLADERAESIAPRGASSPAYRLQAPVIPERLRQAPDREFLPAALASPNKTPRRLGGDY